MKLESIVMVVALFSFPGCFSRVICPGGERLDQGQPISV